MNITQNTIFDLIQRLPKSELHLHIESTLEPEMFFHFAERNEVAIQFNSIDEVKRAYQFSELSDFLAIYHPSMTVFCTEQDFFDVTWAYFQKVAKENLKHAEIFFAPQLHTERGIEFDVIFQGIHRAQEQARQQLGISSYLMLNFLRDRTESSAMTTLEQSLDYKPHIIAVGLESTEIGNPPSKFTRVFDRASAEGLKTVVHGGPEGPLSYLWEAIEILKVSRIDHGVRCLEDNNLVELLRQQQIPLTVCPVSNVKLGVFKQLKDHNLKLMLDAGLCVTINSDIPPYIDSYLSDNFIQSQQALNLNAEEIVKLTKNAFIASFLSDCDKKHYLSLIDAMYDGFIAA